MNPFMTPKAVYVSHPIRGNAENPTPEQIWRNCQMGVDVGRVLSFWFSSVEFYVPGEHDHFPQMAMSLGYLSVDDVIDIDCAILQACQAVVAVYPVGESPSAGMMEEINCADEFAIPVLHARVKWDGHMWIVNNLEGILTPLLSILGLKSFVDGLRGGQ